MHPIVHTAARRQLECILAIPRGLRQQVSTADQHMSPRYPSRAPRAHVNSHLIAEIFYVLIVVDRWPKPCRNISLNPIPVICEVCQRCVQSRHARTEQIGTEPQELYAHAQLPPAWW